MNESIAREVIAPFYDALNRPADKDVAALIRGATTTDWRSYSGDDVWKGREELIQQVVGFGKLIPDLAWTIREVLVAGDRVIVRSEAAGTPVGPLFGVAPSGRAFRIMTLDVHTVRDGKLAVAHHVEDWAGALAQLRG